MTNPFLQAKSVFDDVPIDFWKQVRTFLEYGYVLCDPELYFCLAYPVDSDADVNTWEVGSGNYVDAWYIHLYGGRNLITGYRQLLDMHDLPKVCFFRWKNGKQGRLRVYDKNKFITMLERQKDG